MRLLAGYSTSSFVLQPSTARTEAHPSASTAAAVWSQQRTQTVRVCAAPTRVPTGTRAPTNVGDTNPPTRAPTFVPTRGPNFADPAGEADARDLEPYPLPLPPSPLPPPLPRALCRLHVVALGSPVSCRSMVRSRAAARANVPLRLAAATAGPRGYCKVLPQYHTVRYAAVPLLRTHCTVLRRVLAGTRGYSPALAGGSQQWLGTA